jgi:hypothetical protein
MDMALSIPMWVQVVPAGLVKRMATKRYRLSDEDEEQDDEEAFAKVE